MDIFNKIKKTNVIRNVWTQMAQITVICGLITAIAVSAECYKGEHCGLAFLFPALIIATATVFAAWLIWFIYILHTQRCLKPMHPKGYKILDTLDFCLFLYWIISSIFPITVGILTLPLIACIWTISIPVALKFKEAPASE